MRIIRNMPPHHSVRYPWKVWTDGKAREAERGVDYLCSDVSFGNALRNHARRHGLKVRQHATTAGMAFQFTVPGGAGTPDAEAEYDQVVRRNPHILAGGATVPPNSGLHRHDGNRCLDGCDPPPPTDHN